MLSIAQRIAEELTVQPKQIEAAVNLLDEGATVPFIARYRKEVTGSLDDTQLRQLEQRLGYLRELEERRQVILKSIADQEKLSSELEQAILAADNKTLLEDLYLPYKPKRRTKGQIAIEAGLEPLADKLFNDSAGDPQQEASAFINPDAGIDDEKAALDGAKYILMERMSEDAALLDKIRRYLKQQAHINSIVVTGKEDAGAKYKDYFEHSELLKSTPSHRALAMFRGRNEGVLNVSLNADPGQEASVSISHCQQLIAEHYGFRFANRPWDGWMQEVVQWAWRIKIAMHMETELLGELREVAEASAIQVFADNLKDLLMAAPAGAKVTLGMDPGLRTGVKLAIVDATGKVLDTGTIFPHAPQNQWDKSIRTLANLCRQHKVELIAIGNGTASRETDKLAAELLAQNPELKASKVVISEAGASVYSASELAANEFPDMDVSLRGAVSIARRLQDPLAELVKIEPKAIGVGQYQHDVSQSHLARSLDAVVEDCVNAVGVDLNMASVPLLTRVSGLNRTLAQNIVQFRDQNGRFADRKALKKVERLGPKAFEQCAGFLKIVGGDNPLDASSVHPEAYPLVEQIVAKTDIAVDQLIGDSGNLKKLDAREFVTNDFGLPTITDIFKELEKPSRDPRPEFKTAQFKEGVNTLKDLESGMILEGVVTNVTHFGAFVDVGVHQDGLVHISAMTDKFISDPREVVKAGDIVKVRVQEVDLERKRIGFTMRLNDTAPPKPAARREDKRKSAGKPSRPQRQTQQTPQNSAMGNAFADAFAKAKKE